MADETLLRDQNHVTVLGAITDNAAQEVRQIRVDPVTNRVLVSASGGGMLTPTTGQYKIFVTVGSANADYLISNYIDIGDAINAAYAALPSAGGTIAILSGTYSFLTPIVFGTNGKFVSLIGFNAASTFLKYTPTSGDALTINCGNPTGHLVYELTGFTLMGKSTLVAAAQTNTNTSRGVVYGGANGCVGLNTHDFNVNGFGINYNVTSNAYMLQWNNITSSGGNGGTNGNLFLINAASNSGERNVWSGCSFTDPGNSIATNAFYITNAGTASNSFIGCSFDDVQLYIGASDGMTTLTACHFENSAYNTYPQYIPILGVSSDKSTMIVIDGLEIANDGNSGGTTFVTIIRHGGQLIAHGIMINNYGGQTVTNVVLHDLDNGVASDLVGMVQIQGGGLTNIIGGSGGVAYTQASGSTWIQNVDNSYTIGRRAMSSNTNETFSGGNITSTDDHGGNYTFGLSDHSSTHTVYGTGKIYNFNTILDASQFTGSDIGAKINAAYSYAINTLAVNGVIITIPAGSYSFSTPIAISTDGYRATIQGAGGDGTILTYTGSNSTTAITINCGYQGDGFGSEHITYNAVKDITLKGNSSTSAAAKVGIYLGGSNGAAGACLRNVKIETFGKGLVFGANTYHTLCDSCVIRNCAQLLYINAASNSGESLRFINCFIVDPFDTTYVTANGVQLADSASASCLFDGCSFDDTQVRIGQANNVTFVGTHWENPGSANWGAYVYLSIDANLATNVSLNGDTFFSTGVTKPTNYIANGGNLTMNGVIVRDFIASTVTNFATLSGSGRITWSGFNNVSGTAITNVVSGVAYVPNGFVNQAGNAWTLDASAVMTATSPVFVTPALGTPASGVGTNITGITAAHVVAGTFGTGAYTMDTSLAVPQVFNAENAVTASANAITFTRANRVNKVTNNSAAGLTITLSTTGAVAGDMLIIKSVPSSAVAQTITWVNTEISDVTPSANLNASTTSPRTDAFMWNSLTSKWRCCASC